MTKDRSAAPNNAYPKVTVKWLNKSLCLIDSEVLTNRHLRDSCKTLAASVTTNRLTTKRRQNINLV